MTSDKITFRIEADEMHDLMAEARLRNESPHHIARERMRAFSTMMDKFDELKREVLELRRDVGRSRTDFANVCKVLLCKVAKESEERAEKWVRENLLK
jgi:hypothetical protein